MKPVILTETHEYVCYGEVDDVHVGDGLHLLVGQDGHQDQKVPTDTHLKHHNVHPCDEGYNMSNREILMTEKIQRRDKFLRGR